MPIRQWLEESDFVARFCTLREYKKHRHARIARETNHTRNACDSCISVNVQKSVTQIIYPWKLPTEKEPQEPALPTPATFVGLAVPAPPPDRYIDSAQSGATTLVETAFVARDLPRRHCHARGWTRTAHWPTTISTLPRPAPLADSTAMMKGNHAMSMARRLRHLNGCSRTSMSRPDIRKAMGLQRTIPQPGMKTLPTRRIQSKRLLSTELRVLARKRRISVSKASPGSADQTT